MSLSESAEPRERDLRGHTGLQASSQYSHGSWPLIVGDREQFLQIEQRVEDRSDLVNGVLLSCTGTAQNDEHTRLARDRSALITIFGT